MNDWTIISGAVSAVLAAILTYYTQRRESLETQEAKAAERRASDLELLVKTLQAELLRKDAENARLMTVLMDQVDKMNKAADDVRTLSAARSE